MNGPKLEDIAKLADDIALSVEDAGPPFWVAFTMNIYLLMSRKAWNLNTYIWNQVKHLGSLHLPPTLQTLSSETSKSSHP